MRFAIEGNRPGTTVHAAGTFVKAQEDGSYRFNQAQKEDLERRGHTLHELTDEAIAAINAATVAVEDADAKLRLAQNKADAEEHNHKTNRAPRKRKN